MKKAAAIIACIMLSITVCACSTDSEAIKAASGDAEAVTKTADEKEYPYALVRPGKDGELKVAAYLDCNPYTSMTGDSYDADGNKYYYVYKSGTIRVSGRSHNALLNGYSIIPRDMIDRF